MCHERSTELTIEGRSQVRSSAASTVATARGVQAELQKFGEHIIRGDDQRLYEAIQEPVCLRRNETGRTSTEAVDLSETSAEAMLQIEDTSCARNICGEHHGSIGDTMVKLNVHLGGQLFYTFFRHGTLKLRSLTGSPCSELPTELLRSCASHPIRDKLRPVSRLRSRSGLRPAASNGQDLCYRCEQVVLRSRGQADATVAGRKKK